MELEEKPAHPETVYTPFRGYTVAITGDQRPLDPSKSPKELLMDKRIKLALLDDKRSTIGTADQFSYKVAGQLPTPSLACPMTNLQRMIESIAKPQPVPVPAA